MTILKKDSRNLFLFFLFTLLWTWGFGFLPVLLGITGTALGTFLFYFGGGAPSVVALFFVFLTYSREERNDYFKRCFSLRQMGIKPWIFLFLFFGFIAVVGIVIAIYGFGMEAPGMEFLKILAQKPYMLPAVIVISIISGPLNEEFGWRGYALDKLIIRFGFYKASLLLGFIWGIWHLPWYFTPNQAQYDLLQASLWNAFLFIPSSIVLCFVVNMVYVYTNRSILAGAMTHMMSNLLTSQLLAPYSAGMGTVIRYVSILCCFLIAVYTMCSKSFQRKLQECFPD